MVKEKGIYRLVNGLQHWQNVESTAQSGSVKVLRKYLLMCGKIYSTRLTRQT
jgi:hypothetical protein